ncbi:helix-turn-helix domain-containing protein [Vibrio astriarenae]
MRRLIFIAVILIGWLFAIQPIYAAGTRTSVFYPLPTLSQGKVFSSKQLFASDTGGIWIHDVHGDVYFFDGDTVLPSRGSIFSQTYDHLTYNNGTFWTFEDHKLLKLVPNQPASVVITITPGQQIQAIGSRDEWVWFTDENHFYTYHIESQTLEHFPLLSVYRQNQSSQIYVTDAERVGSKWVLATNSGVYVSSEREFQHVPASGKRYIEKLHYSSNRQEMVVGTLNGALVFGIHKQTKMPRYIGSSHVLSIAETDEGYWVGTENGLFVYTSETGGITQLQSSQLSDYNLVGDKVYALVNDQHGGLWVGSDRGVRYHSLFSRHFSRLSANEVTKMSRGEKALYLTASEQSEGYWLATNEGLYKLNPEKRESPKLVYRGKVLDVAQYQQSLWLATPEGIVSFDLLTNSSELEYLPPSVKPPQSIELTIDGTLWGVSDQSLWQLNFKTNEFRSLGKDWWISQYLPAKVTELVAHTDESVFIGTDHGLYILKQNRVRFVRQSYELGEVIDIKVTQDKVWVAATYGLYELDLDSLALTRLETVSAGIGPRCLTATDHGVWLASSMGLSLYQHNGTLSRHYSPPQGTINNEFLANICVNEQFDVNQVSFGTRSGLLSFNATELLEASQPETQIVFSQVDVNYHPIQTGMVNRNPISIEFGDSISFLIGTLPSNTGNRKYYRLGSEKEWTPLEGRQVTIDRLHPGQHQIEVQLISPFGKIVATDALTFEVQKPWFMKPMALALFTVASVCLILGLIIWRSRRVMLANRRLRAQVALKTNQLKHQSKAVLNSNKLLRKQIEIRQALLGNMSLSQCHDGNSVAEGEPNQAELMLRMSGERHIFEPIAYDLLPISKLAIECWQHEFDLKGVSIELKQQEPRACAMIQQMNLDNMLNVILASSLRRIMTGGSLLLEWKVDENQVSLLITDQGRQLPMFLDERDKQQGSLTYESLPYHASLSGGLLTREVSSQKNCLILAWDIASCFNQAASELIERSTDVSRDYESRKADYTANQKHSNTPHNRSTPLDAQTRWLHRVEALLEEHYSDAQFGTAQAAKLLFTSERSLQRKFKSMTNKTFTEALIELRLEKACEKLLSGQRISDVAFDCGFNDHSYFSQRFKLHYGLSPSRFVDTQSGVTELV